MKTNSKLTKRLLAVALAVCMLCSVLVAGIGTGITAKAAVSSVEVKMYADALNWWPQVRPTDTVKTNGTKTIGGTLNEGSGFEQCQLEIFYGADDGITVSNVALTIDGSDVSIGDWYDSASGKHTFYINDKTAYASTTWSGQRVEWTYTIAGIEEAVEEEESATDTSGSDTEEEAKNTATFSYQDCGNWWSTATSTDDLGTGTYIYRINDAAAWNGGISGSMNAYFTMPNFYTVLSEAGYTEADVTADVTIEMDGVEIANGAYVFVKDNGVDLEVCINNCWITDSLNGATWTDSCVFTIDLTLPEEFGTGGCDKTLVAAAEEEEEDDTPLKGTTGKKKANGYIHDKGAIFVYTGDTYDIYDFNLATGWAFGKVHEINGKWGDSYFGEGGIAGVGTNEGTTIKGNGIYMKYWEDYRGIGYPAIQLSWDTDRIFYLGDITVYSNDWAIQQVFSVGDGFYRGPAERYAGTGEALLDGSNKWYYFGEGSYKAATSTEDTTTEETVVLSEGTVNVTGDGDIYAFVAIGADNTASDWAYSWAGLKPEEVDDANKIPAGITANAVNAKIGEQFTISVATETPVYYTWYVCPTIIVGAGKTVDAEVVAVRVDGKDVTNLIDFAAGDAWWYEDTGNYTEKNGNQAVRLAGGYNEWGTKYTGESPAGYSLIEYDVIINSVA